MRRIKWVLWGGFAGLTVLWLAANPAVFSTAEIFALRRFMTQYTGLIAMAAMSVAMILALRPRWPERWFGGLDKMYRLHKWLGISALVVSVLHWLWVQAPKWAVGWGWLARPQRGQRGPAASEIEAALRSMRHTAEGLGEWAFYAAIILIGAALLRIIPYRVVFKTHRLLAASYLVLVFHTLVLFDFQMWGEPVGLGLAALLGYGVWAAILVLLRKVGRERRVNGTITALDYYPGVHALEAEIAMEPGWPGHKAGQFAFVTSQKSEGAHPYTLASRWDGAEQKLRVIVKELGDHTNHLRDHLQAGQPVTVEGPYGCFTFEDEKPGQIWIGGGIGITPFISRMKELADKRQAGATGLQQIDLFHCSADSDETAFAKLTADAKAAGVRLHLMIDAKDGLLTGERIRKLVPDWKRASVWFCGPAGFGDHLRTDFAKQGLSVTRDFHQELFAMR